MIRLAATFAMLTAPAFAADPAWQNMIAETDSSAQDADPESQLIEGFMVCALAGRDAETAAANLGLYGWTHEPAEGGIIMALPGVGGDTFAILDMDGGFCDVTSLSIGTNRAAEIMATSLQYSGLSSISQDTDAAGCTRILIGEATATLTDGRDPPACASPTTATFHFTYTATD